MQELARLRKNLAGLLSENVKKKTVLINTDCNLCPHSWHITPGTTATTHDNDAVSH